MVTGEKPEGTTESRNEPGWGVSGACAKQADSLQGEAGRKDPGVRPTKSNLEPKRFRDYTGSPDRLKQENRNKSVARVKT